ncbi:WAT1-related protein At4g30420-like [Humulus lupulus]|uniref:WAT1-related protein At4g30420-like n=1 Tax=Humulus lupulus TaxID=3486 RepID=UPI002B413DD0|nr:WAT1-related protein At4g30420-like [Humulus lupulus]
MGKATAKAPELVKFSGVGGAAILFKGIGTAVSFFVQAWCIQLRGHVFVAMFSPLCTVITAIIASLFLHEKLYVGSLVGVRKYMYKYYIYE